MDKLKEMFKGKKGKWFLIAGGVVVVIAFLALRNKSSGNSDMLLSEYPTYSSNTGTGAGSAEESISASEVSNMVGELSRDMSAALKAQETQNTDMSKAFASSLANTQSSLAQMFGTLTSSNQAQLDSITSSLHQDLLTGASQKVVGSVYSGDDAADHAHANQVLYLNNKVAEAAATGNKGLDTWAKAQLAAGAPTEPAKVAAVSSPTRTAAENQTLYLNNKLAEAKATGNTGLATWATSQLKAM